MKAINLDSRLRRRYETSSKFLDLKVNNTACTDSIYGFSRSWNEKYVIKYFCCVSAAPPHNESPQSNKGDYLEIILID